MSTATVYALADPRDHAVRYIGSTSDPERRLRAHVTRAKNRVAISRLYANGRVDPKRDAKALWITELDAEGLEPLFIVLAVLPEREAREAEAEFIQLFAAHTRLLQKRGTCIRYAELARYIGKHPDQPAAHLEPEAEVIS